MGHSPRREGQIAQVASVVGVVERLGQGEGTRKGKQSGATRAWAVEVHNQCVLNGHMDSSKCPLASGRFGP